ncbi:MAG: ribonuclease P protein component [Treponema sp.]|nr:ribonuclease P protein component [Treponema sp.]
MSGAERGTPSFRFSRKEHLRGRDEIREVFKRGRSLGCGGAKLFLLRNSLDYNRICFALPRKFGNAVERNRSRRFSREAYRHIRPRLRGGYDAVLLVYPDPAASLIRTDLAGRAKQLKTLFARAGLLRESV